MNIFKKNYKIEDMSKNLGKCCNIKGMKLQRFIPELENYRNDDGMVQEFIILSANKTYNGRKSFQAYTISLRGEPQTIWSVEPSIVYNIKKIEK